MLKQENLEFEVSYITWPSQNKKRNTDGMKEYYQQVNTTIIIASDKTYGWRLKLVIQI
jgi:hypothetical protein